LYFYTISERICEPFCREEGFLDRYLYRQFGTPGHLLQDGISFWGWRTDVGQRSRRSKEGSWDDFLEIALMRMWSVCPCVCVQGSFRGRGNVGLRKGMRRSGILLEGLFVELERSVLIYSRRLFGSRKAFLEGRRGGCECFIIGELDDVT
jgi:hypothetical protein